MSRYIWQIGMGNGFSETHLLIPNLTHTRKQHNSICLSTFSYCGDATLLLSGHDSVKAAVKQESLGLSLH